VTVATRRGRERDRERYPDVAAEIGHDPARFLDAPLDDREPLIRARVRGICDTDVLDAWVRVEAALERGPRQQVIALLNRRTAALDDDGGGREQSERRQA
jgi:hypothetical protein